MAILFYNLALPLSSSRRQLPPFIVTTLKHNAQFTDFVVFSYIVGSSSRLLCRATQQPSYGASLPMSAGHPV